MAGSSEKIRALTTAIYLLQPQGIPSESPISTVLPEYRHLSKAYNHLAILLSQESKGAVAVTGNTDRSAICAVNVQEIEESLHTAFTENADHGPSDKDPLKVQEIKPSTTSLHDLADPSMKYVHLRLQPRNVGVNRPRIPILPFYVKDRAERCDMQLASINELNSAFFTLNSLLYANRAFETILAIPSLENRIFIAMRLRAKLVNSNEESDALDSDVLFDEDYDQARSPLLRHCMGMVAWHRAALSLSRSKLFKDRLPQFHMVLSSPVYNPSMVDLQTLMKEVILPELSIPDAAAYVNRLLDLEMPATKVVFTGKIHCEATMMALIHSFTSKVSSKPVTPFTNKVTADLRLLLSNADRVIGIAKKSCLCCYWLGQLLQTDTKEFFVLPGMHGRIFPWTPPSDVPFEVLQSLEQKLVSKLVEVTTTRILNQPRRWDSRQSSPVDSDHEDVNMHVYIANK